MRNRARKNLCLLFFIIIGSLVVLGFSGCAAHHKNLVAAAPPPVAIKGEEYPVPSYAFSLKGQKICLDPGHGGDADVPNYKRGPTGVREAEVNLRVALFLKKWLEEAGAQVYMTRTTDVFVGLDERSYMANTCGAEFFVSLHHNAISNPSTNFTSTWYHATPDTGPLSLDLARYIQDGVADALNLLYRASIPLKSDYQIYPDSGFAVLRNARIPAALCEASFHSNPEEEKRLDNPEYNKREAYGYFIGLAKFFYSGIPRVKRLSPQPVIEDRTPLIQYKINDGLGGKEIIEGTISLQLDGQPVPCSYDRVSGIITAVPPQPLANNWHTLQPQFMNLNKTSVYPETFKFQVVPPLGSLVLKYTPADYPADGAALSCLKVEARDVQGNPVADGMEIELTANRGTILTSRLTTQDGYALGYWQAPFEEGPVLVKAEKGNISAIAALSVQSTNRACLQGKIVFSENGEPFENALIAVSSLAEHPVTASQRDGFFCLGNIPPGRHWIEINAVGYKSLKIPLEFISNQTRKIQISLDKEP
jgi:N-acetylmuramoyl-L-alanine amidase